MAASIAVWASDGRAGARAVVVLPGRRRGRRRGFGAGGGDRGEPLRPRPLWPIMTVSCCCAVASWVCSWVCCVVEVGGLRAGGDLARRSRRRARRCACSLSVPAVGQGRAGDLLGRGGLLLEHGDPVDDVGPVGTGGLEQRGALDQLAGAAEVSSAAAPGYVLPCM